MFVKTGPFRKVELAGMRVEDRAAENVFGQQIRRELDVIVLGIE